MKAFYPATQEQIDQLETLQDFRDYYASTPAEKWIKGDYNKPGGCHCAFGWLGFRDFSGPTKASRSIIELVNNSLLIGANDGTSFPYTPLSSKQQTPKYRVLAYLDELIKKSEASGANCP